MSQRHPYKIKYRAFQEENGLNTVSVGAMNVFTCEPVKMHLSPFCDRRAQLYYSHTGKMKKMWNLMMRGLYVEVPTIKKCEYHLIGFQTETKTLVLLDQNTGLERRDVPFPWPPHSAQCGPGGQGEVEDWQELVVKVWRFCYLDHSKYQLLIKVLSWAPGLPEEKVTCVGCREVAIVPDDTIVVSA